LLTSSATQPASTHHGQLGLAASTSVAMKSPLGGQIEMPVPGTIASSWAKPQPST
jgi:hypothetical protein